MNHQPKNSKPLDWKKILVVIAILGIAGYRWYVDDPQAEPNDRAVATQNGDGQVGSGQAESDSQIPETLPGDFSDRQNSSSRSGSTAAGSTPGASAGNGDSPVNQQRPPPESQFLVAIGKNQFQSPAGLIYGMGGGGEHRIDHVMRHAEDDPGRPAHGVFDGDRDDILKLLDEVYEMIKQKSKYVKTEKSQGNTAYTVSLGRQVGYEGGQKGKRSGNRGLRSVRLVLDGNRVITAYPYR